MSMSRGVCALAVTTAVALTTVACSGPPQPVTSTAPATTGQAPVIGAEPVSRWERVLARLDSARQAAYAAGDPAQLADVYVAGSAVLRRDRRLLAAYERRGVRLRGVRLELLDVALRDRDGRSVRLDVVDRLARPTAYTATGTVALPHDLPTRRIIVLEVERGRWRIAAVRRVAG